MNLKNWRASMGYPQEKVARELSKAFPEQFKSLTKQSICYWEKKGVGNYKRRDALRALSKNKINDFGGEE